MRLDTPRAAIESFLDALRSEDFGRAGHALNLNAIPPEEQAHRAPELALKLAFVLRRYSLVDWSELPDQPDARVLPGVQDATGPYRRRSLELGEVELEGRPIPVTLQRIRTGEEEPVWLFAPFAVERVDAIFAEAQPGLLARWIPLEERLRTLGQPSIWEWSAATVLLLVAALIGLMILYVARRLSRRLRPLRPRRAREVRRSAIPLAILVGALAFRLGTENLILLTGPVAAYIDVVPEVAALVSGAWLLFRIVNIASLTLSERYIVPLAIEDPENRRPRLPCM